MSEIQIFIAEHLLPLEGEVLSPGALACRDGRILAVGSPESLRQRFPEASCREFPEQCLLPGLVNAHLDLSLTLFDNYPHDLPESRDGRLALMPWLINVSRFKAKLPIADQQKAIRAGLDRVKASGVTTLGDICRYPAALPLYEASGLRVVALAEIENIQRILAQEEFEQALALADEIQHAKNPRLLPGLAPFSAYTISKNMLRILGHHAIQARLPLRLHAALSFGEMEFFYDSQGEVTQLLFKEAGWGEEKIPPPHRVTPIQYLHEIGLLKARPSLLGCLHLGPTDSALLDNAGCVRLFAPTAFESLQIGEIPWGRLGKSSWALASWSKAAGATLNLWDEMRSALFQLEAKLGRQGAAAQVFQAATLAGARALGLEAETGSLRPGKSADFLLIDSPVEDSSLEAGLIEQSVPQRIRGIYVAGNLLNVSDNLSLPVGSTS